MSAKRILKAGIVGGGSGAFIGAVHRIAVELDGEARVVAGAMSSDPQRAHESAEQWHLERSYDSFETMATAEAARQDGIDFVMITTPNNLHLPVAKAFLEAGIHVICDKPMASSLAEAQAMATLVQQTGKLFGLTHTYTGYPMVREAQAMVANGELGDIRKVLVEYNQDWLMEPQERLGNKQAEWRTDPARAGISCCVGDIGTHAHNLVEFITGQSVTNLCADLTAFVDGQPIDDDANMLIRLSGGGKGTLVCSQIACGEENALNIRVYGSRGGLEWHQQEPNTLLFKPAGQPWQRIRTAVNARSQRAAASTRTPGGHPEGYLEAFANVYRDFMADVHRVINNGTPLCNYPGAEEGVRGLAFVEASVRSSQAGASWVALT